VGEPDAGYFVFQMNEDVPSSAPISTVLSALIVVDFASFELSGTLENGIIFVEE
jgi:hypothetical protein